MKNLVLILILSLISVGCLATRDQIRQVDSKRETQETVLAQTQAQYQDLEAEIRNLNGRVASLENSLGATAAEKRSLESQFENERRQQESRLKIYEEALTKIEQQYLTLSQKVEALQLAQSSAAKAAPAASPAPAASKGKGKTDFFQLAEDDFQKKNFRQAIVNYQKYRETNPKGAQYSEATYKMGVCFQELKMADEAEPFFNEVVQKFPKSKAAEKAKIRLKKK